ncbi:DUF3995 domain-containing protein [Brevibacillus migulae]|uniref:DUF3995 domain-containing protein n=1 Tax=Brevibacillus migulae TaxID=1644114 RepID=UPI00106E552B|nr:DUF3995 domain-containing protein [Brevibacillus migulae]
MLSHIITWIVGIILSFLSVVHLYWMAGGKKGTIAALPSRGAKLLFRPTIVGTGLVAIALAVSGWYVFELGGVVNRSLFPGSLFPYGGWVLSLVFIIRAVGDFRWVGFFKKHKGTVFAKWDSVLYSPLCLFLGFSLVFITLTQKY